MTPSISAPPLLVRPEPLTQHAYASFGTVIESKVGALQPPGVVVSEELPEKCVVANQGTAIKQLDVTRMTDYYALAASGQPSKAVVNMFSCAPRALRRHGSGEKMTLSIDLLDESQNLRFDVSILERHPYTSQSFVPLGVAAGDKSRRYLVIVAPTKEQANAPIRHHQQASPAPPRGSGPPDLQGLRAFVATGAQAVTYGAGTWHAPMVVLGTQSIDFVVMQFANGVGDDDCQEVLVAPERDGCEGVSVLIALPDDAKIGKDPAPRTKL